MISVLVFGCGGVIVVVVVVFLFVMLRVGNVLWLILLFGVIGRVGSSIMCDGIMNFGNWVCKVVSRLVLDMLLLFICVYVMS